jgi:xylulokinase
MPHYLTFDLGTTSLKTALVSDEGAVLAVHTEEYHLQTPQPGWAEMEAEVYWRAAGAGTAAVMRGSDPAGVAAIGFAAQGQSFLAVDSTGRPLRDAIVWVDNRSEEIARRWEGQWLARQEYRRISGYAWIPGEMTIFKLAWLAENERAAHRAWKFLFLPDYLIWRLTGEVATDYNLAQMSGMYDVQARDWEPRLLAAAGVKAEQLPRVHAPGTVVGRLREGAARELGLAAGTPVCVGCNDQLAGALGAGNVAPGLVTETTGTALAVIATTEALRDDPRLFAGRHAAPGLYYTMTFAPTSAIVLKWLRDLCAPGEDYESFLAGVAQVPAGCDGLTVLPHFCGTATPTYNAQARGAFAGLTLGHTRAHLARAVMEACACLLQEVLEPLQEGGAQIESVRSLGGAARSDLWLQMKADLLGLPVERPACADAANLGAAMLAATGVGQFAQVQDAARAWYRAERRFAPEERRYEVYRGVYGRYRELYGRLYGG